MSAAFPERRRLPSRQVLHPAGPPSSQPRLISRLVSPELKGVEGNLDRIFDSLEALSYLGEAELRDFFFFRGIFDEALEGIDRKIASGRLRPLALPGFPTELRYPSQPARIGVFIGSFDPFQMTHLVMALRFLGSDASEADALFIVPEGSRDPRKPQRTDYGFRFELLERQVSGVLEPFVRPLDIGDGADTIEIVRRLIELHAGSSLRLTHLLGSDVLPLAASFLAQDLEAWTAEARKSKVDLEFSVHVGRRDASHLIKPYAEAVRSRGIRIVIDREVIGTPSSTAFRDEGAISLVLPTPAVLSRLELLFRYGMSRPWSACPLPGPGRAPEGAPGPRDPEYEI